MARHPSPGVFTDAVTVAVPTAGIGTEIGKDGKAHPDPIETDHTAASDQKVYQGGPGGKDHPQDGPDEALENGLIIHRPDQPPDQHARTRPQEQHCRKKAAHDFFSSLTHFFIQWVTFLAAHLAGHKKPTALSQFVGHPPSQ